MIEGRGEERDFRSPHLPASFSPPLLKRGPRRGEKETGRHGNQDSTTVSSKVARRRMCSCAVLFSGPR